MKTVGFFRNYAKLAMFALEAYIGDSEIFAVTLAKTEINLTRYCTLDYGFFCPLLICSIPILIVIISCSSSSVPNQHIYDSLLNLSKFLPSIQKTVHYLKFQIHKKMIHIEHFQYFNLYTKHNTSSFMKTNIILPKTIVLLIGCLIILIFSLQNN